MLTRFVRRSISRLTMPKGYTFFSPPMGPGYPWNIDLRDSIRFDEPLGRGKFNQRRGSTFSTVLPSFRSSLSSLILSAFEAFLPATEKTKTHTLPCFTRERNRGKKEKKKKKKIENRSLLNFEISKTRFSRTRTIRFIASVA